MPRFCANLTMLGCRQLNCLASITPADALDDRIERTFVGNRRFAAAMLEEAGIRLLIEPVITRDIPGVLPEPDRSC